MPNALPALPPGWAYDAGGIPVRQPTDDERAAQAVFAERSSGVAVFAGPLSELIDVTFGLAVKPRAVGRYAADARASLTQFQNQTALAFSQRAPDPEAPGGPLTKRALREVLSDPLGIPRSTRPARLFLEALRGQPNATVDRARAQAAYALDQFESHFAMLVSEVRGQLKFEAERPEREAALARRIEAAEALSRGQAEQTAKDAEQAAKDADAAEAQRRSQVAATLARAGAVGLIAMPETQPNPTINPRAVPRRGAPAREQSDEAAG